MGVPGDRKARPAKRSLVIVANRLPVHRAGASGRWESSAGGLVTALAPLLQRMPGSWIGWAGGAERAPRRFTHEGINYRPVSISRAELDAYYHGLSNRTFWPLYHDAIRTPEFRQDWWEPYRAVNRRFADAAARASTSRDLIWVHDYHLQLVPAMVREKRPRARIGFFLHIPFPPEELFEWLPWRAEVLRGLLGADVIGFQTHSAAQNFSRLCRKYTSAEGSGSELRYEGRRIVVREFPISIDFQWFDVRAKSQECRRRVEELRNRLGESRKVLMAIDRLDYTKGILERLAAYEELLRRGYTTVDETVLVQIATPSREAVADYSRLRDQVDRAVGRINGQFSEPGRVAVHYFRRNLTRRELVAYYGAADVMLVTPLRDGMNLVAKEYVACRPHNSGVLVLSEFAGAAKELAYAMIMNPRDQSQFTEVMRDALRMPARDASMRMSALRSRVKRHDVYDWCGGFLRALEGPE